MNDFIVWDKYRKVWIDESYPFFINSSGFLCIQRNDKQMVIENDCEIFKPIGLKDTEGNKIYADSSIIEFVHIGRLSNHALKKVGIFKFIKKDLQYRVIDLECNKDGLEVESPFHKLCAFKIIDTIQENKLGLIK